MKNSNLLTVVSRISLVLNCELTELMPKQNIFGWTLKDSQVFIDLNKNEIQIIDEPDFDDKTLFALYGIAHLNKLTVEHYFSN